MAMKSTYLRKNEKTWKRSFFITGKGRCNVTNACDVDELFQNMVSNEKFMYSSFYGFTNQDVMDFFENAGLRLKTERGNRVFPQSDHSSDVIRTLELEMKRNGVHIHLYSNVEKVVAEDGRFSYLVMADGSKEEGDACIIATGGVSYQTTGSTGDGYRFARSMGHKNHRTCTFPGSDECQRRVHSGTDGAFPPECPGNGL